MFYWMVMHHMVHGYVEQQFETLQGLHDAIDFALQNGWDVRGIKVMNGNQEAHD